MITVHIKSTIDQSVRTEEWDDWKVDVASRQFVVEREAYALEYPGEESDTNTVVVAKFFWNIIEELNVFGSSKDTSYTAMPAFVRDTVTAIGEQLNLYLQIEPTFHSVKAATDVPLADYVKTVPVIQTAVYTIYEQVEVVRPTVIDVDPANEQEAALRSTLIALSDFAMALYDSVKALRPIVEKLHAAQLGRKYDPVQYVTDIKTLEGLIARRNAAAESFKGTQQGFIAAFPV